MPRFFLGLHKVLLTLLVSAAVTVIGWAANRAVQTFDKMDTVHTQILQGVTDLSQTLKVELNRMQASLSLHEQKDLLVQVPLDKRLQDHEVRLRAIEGKPLAPFRYER